jgi:hypothetical protein
VSDKPHQIRHRIGVEELKIWLGDEKKNQLLSGAGENSDESLVTCGQVQFTGRCDL